MKYVSVAVLLLTNIALAEEVMVAPTVKPLTQATLFSYGGSYTMSPAPVIHSDSGRIRIEDVEKVTGPHDTILTKLTYTPWYGKIDSQSLEFRKQHESQNISILLSGDYTSKVKKGDILRSCYYTN